VDVPDFDFSLLNKANIVLIMVSLQETPDAAKRNWPRKVCLRRPRKGRM
jgi:hypothetical protein